MENNRLEDLNINELSTALKLIAEPSRLKILSSLNLNCQPVADIVTATEIGQTTVSFHLKLLREAGMVRPKRMGNQIFYCLPDQKLVDLICHFNQWMENRQTFKAV
ncbi:MAG: metalloregulator ArsR/SmtB family transcription factor [Gammaproteobacteria bacterium]|nr:metalloregulator ArsR/SmtB family transcription factor [Gammaproteobacteria bacterium]